MSIEWKTNIKFTPPIQDLYVNNKYQHCWVRCFFGQWQAVMFSAGPPNPHTYHACNSEEEAKQFLIARFVERRMNEARQHRTY